MLKVNNQKQQVLDYLRKHPGGHTIRDIEKGTGIPHECMGSITKELLAKKLIAKTGEERRTDRGKNAEVYDLYERVTGKPALGPLFDFA